MIFELSPEELNTTREALAEYRKYASKRLSETQKSNDAHLRQMAKAVWMGRIEKIDSALDCFYETVG